MTNANVCIYMNFGEDIHSVLIIYTFYFYYDLLGFLQPVYGIIIPLRILSPNFEIILYIYFVF